MEALNKFAIGDKVKEISTGKYGSVSEIDGSGSVPEDQVICVRFDDDSAVTSSLASEYTIVRRRTDRDGPRVSIKDKDGWMA